MVELVDIEAWRRWLTGPRGRRAWIQWSRAHPALAGWEADTLARPRWSPAVDDVQRALVALSQQGHGRAATTLLVQLRPGLGQLVRSRQSTWGETRAEAVDEVRSAFYETLCRHPLERRPNRIAANLVLDTRQRLGRGAAAGRRPPPVPDHDLTGRAAAGAAGEIDPVGGLDPALALGRAVTRLPGSERSRALTAEAAYRAWILDQPHRLIADELGLDRAAVRARLHRLRAAVRHQWDDAA